MRYFMVVFVAILIIAGCNTKSHLSMRDQERRIQEWIQEGNEKMANKRIQSDAQKDAHR